jgi:hypothetical protein
MITNTVHRINSIKTTDTLGRYISHPIAEEQIQRDLPDSLMSFSKSQSENQLLLSTTKGWNTVYPSDTDSIIYEQSSIVGCDAVRL